MGNPKGITLDATDETVTFVLGDGTTGVEFYAAYVDFPQGSFKGKASVPSPPAAANEGASNGTTSVVAVAAPAATATRRIVSYMSFCNTDGSTRVVTVRHTKSSTSRRLVQASLTAGYQLQWTQADGWRVLDTTGALSYTAGGDGTQSANTIKAGPASGAAATPSYRAQVVADLPTYTGHTAETALASADEFPFYDASATANRKVTLTNLAAGLDGEPWTFADLVNISEEWRVSGVISPSALASNTDNWNPTNLHTVTTVRVDLDASVNLTGMDAGSAGEIKILHNIDAALYLTIKNNVTSTAANRFLMSSDLTLGPDESAAFWYDTTSARWRPWKSETEQPSFHVRRTTDQTAIVGFVKITWSTEVTDTHGFFASSTFTPLIPGSYWTSLTVTGSAMDADEQIIGAIYKNGAAFQYLGNAYTPSASQYPGVSGSCIVPMNGTTDYLDAYVYISPGDDLYGDASGFYTWWMGTRIGP